MTLTVRFCGEVVAVPDDREFLIGRDGDLIVDENPFLHRHFLALRQERGMWLLTNVGDQLTATVTDVDGRLEALLGPGGTLPIVFEQTMVRFAAGPTTYELSLERSAPAYRGIPRSLLDPADGATTVGRVTLTADQRLMVLALCESALRSGGAAAAVLPTAGQAASRLGWTTTKFRRKLDNVCEKLARVGVRGLLGESGNLASNRRARLVEYALATRLVTRDDLRLLDAVDDPSS